MRRLTGTEGAVLVVDERNADRFSTEADPIERMCYGFSVHTCLAASIADGTPSAATGTVMRRETFETYAREAGFREVEVLPVEYPLFRFYRPRG
jgi:hypothetical protein